MVAPDGFVRSASQPPSGVAVDPERDRLRSRLATLDPLSREAFEVRNRLSEIAEREARKANERAADTRAPQVETKATPPLIFHSASDWALRPPPQREWIVEGLIPVGGVTLLSGDGGVGKSTIALQLALAVDGGRNFMGRRTTRAPILAWFCEDTEEELQRRAVAIAQVDGVDLAASRALVRSGVDDDTIIFEPSHSAASGAPTPAFTQLRAAALSHRARLVILDGAADIFGGDEIKRAQVRSFIRLLVKLAREIKGSVLLLTHPSQAGKVTGEGTSGSTAWNNSVRSRLYLTRQGQGDERVLQVMKSNYAPVGEKIALRYDRGAFVLDNGQTAIQSDPAADTREVSILRRLINESGFDHASPKSGEVVTAVRIDAWRYAVYATRQDQTHDAKKKAFQRAMRTAVSAGVIDHDEVFVWSRGTRGTLGGQGGTCPPEGQGTRGTSPFREMSPCPPHVAARTPSENDADRRSVVDGVSEVRSRSEGAAQPVARARPEGAVDTT